MKFIKPNFYDAFHCTAAACSDTCCAGWEIDVDPDTVEYYENLEGELGDRLREELCDLPDGTVCFRLGENERCPFLDDDNLCELILKLGDDALCEICREHPRFYEELGGRVEMGVGLCCEEACRLLFEQKNPVTFITTNVGELPNAPEDPLVFHLRDEAFAIVQDRSLPLRVRMNRLLDFGVQAQKTLFGNMSPAERDTTDETDTRAALFDMMTEMEPYDETWPDYVQLAMSDEMVGECYYVMQGASEFVVTGKMKDFDIREDLHKIKVPTLMLSGTNDEATPYVVKEGYDLIPDCEWALIQGAAHIGNATHGEEYMEAVENFISRFD